MKTRASKQGNPKHLHILRLTLFREDCPVCQQIAALQRFARKYRDWITSGSECFEQRTEIADLLRDLEQSGYIDGDPPDQFQKLVDKLQHVDLNI